MTQVDLSSEVGAALPYLRRYARALTGSQSSGDNYAAATLEAVLADRSVVSDASSPKVGLFAMFHGIWVTTGAPVEEEDAGPRAIAQKHLQRLTTNSREALLLHTIEEFNLGEVAEIMQIGSDEAENLVTIARQEMADGISGRVLIIEDEAIIAMDLESIVADLGHRVTGVARTRDGAVKLGTSDAPDLILADIQLADNSSGVDAVRDLLAELGHRPVIFITAFPERLLTGERPEPAFLISKPYSEDQVRSAISQAMFFSSTETLKV
ncbi:response regulator [Puniceibacterium sediminis]|uniref:Response regulator receiver protein n=1 Tax=Puniceibacterium sediminis TaxID=1608407 RepID=A0A238V107_9RHOB|nr:response regulator [Puniceibacterium sediminis]SNR27908.1 response regulator receiver protein [Puniceibacterium sediminis]